jgi:hypothetical protein
VRGASRTVEVRVDTADAERAFRDLTDVAKAATADLPESGQRAVQSLLTSLQQQVNSRKDAIARTIASGVFDPAELAQQGAEAGEFCTAVRASDAGAPRLSRSCSAHPATNHGNR